MLIASVPRLELMMRVLPFAIASALTLASLSTSLQGQRPVAPVNPRSMQLLGQGKAERAAGHLDAATDTLETAVAVDPRNREAFIVLAQVAEARDLPGKAIRLYREALTLEPNDVAALRGQGEALVQKGAVAQAQANLAKIRTLCKAGCGEATQLAAVIAKGPPIVPVQTAAQADTAAQPKPE